MRPLIEKSAGSGSAKKPGRKGGSGNRYENLASVLKRKMHGSETGGTSETADGAAKVEPVVEEGVVKKIIVRCSCGEVIEIDCDYAD